MSRIPTVEVIQRQTVTNTISTKPQKKRVAAYCRVSTELEEQQSSLELQMSAFREQISTRPDWELAGIYADVDTPYGQNPKSPWIADFLGCSRAFLFQCTSMVVHYRKACLPFSVDRVLAILYTHRYSLPCMLHTVHILQSMTTFEIFVLIESFMNK